MRPTSLGPAGLALAAVLALCVIAPPEVRGSGLAAAALFIAVAAVATGGIATKSLASRWVVALIPLVLLASRTAIAPGEVVRPAACLLLAAFAGIAAAAGGTGADRLAWLYGAVVAWAGGRALYEAIWGLAAWAAEVRASAPQGSALDVLNRLEQGRPYGGFVTPAALGCLLAMTIPAVAAWSLGMRGKARAAGFGAVLLGSAGLIATRSLSAMLALGVALLLAALRGRLAPRALAVATAVIAVSVIGVGIVRHDAVFVPTREDSPWRLRAGNVRIALAIARDHPLLGVGPGGYAEAFPQYRSTGDNESRHAHDLPAELVAEWGIPAGLALSALFFWIFLSPVVFGSGDPRTLHAGLAVGLAAFALHNVVDFTAFLPSLLFVAAVTRGLLAKPVTSEPGAIPQRVGWAVLVLAVAASAAASGLSQDALFHAREAAVAGDHAEALRLAQRAERLAPWEVDPSMLQAAARMAAGPNEPARSLADADRAVALAPERASARWLRARVRSASGDAPGAYADTVEAARLYPMRPEYAAQAASLSEALRKASAGAPR